MSDILVCVLRLRLPLPLLDYNLYTLMYMAVFILYIRVGLGWAVIYIRNTSGANNSMYLPTAYCRIILSCLSYVEKSKTNGLGSCGYLASI